MGEAPSNSGIIRGEVENTNGFASTECRVGRTMLLLPGSVGTGEEYLGDWIDGELTAVSDSADWGLLISR